MYVCMNYKFKYVCNTNRIAKLIGQPTKPFATPPTTAHFFQRENIVKIEILGKKRNLQKRNY